MGRSRASSDGDDGGPSSRARDRHDDADSALGDSVREEQRSRRSHRSRRSRSAGSREFRSRGKRRSTSADASQRTEELQHTAEAADDSAYVSVRAEQSGRSRGRRRRTRSRQGGDARDDTQQSEEHGDAQAIEMAERDSRAMPTAEAAHDGGAQISVITEQPVADRQSQQLHARMGRGLTAEENAWSYYSYFALQESDVRRVMAGGFKRGQVLPVKATDLPVDITADAAPRVLVLNRPVFTCACVVAEIVLYIVAMAGGGAGDASMDVNPWFGPPWSRLRTLGAKWFPDIRDGQVWRFLSAAFVPPGLIILLLSIVFHVLVCAPVERLHGWRRVGAIYICAAVFAVLCSAIFVPANIYVGPTGAMYGIAGVLYCDVAENWPYLQSPERDVFVLFAVTVGSLGLGLLPGIDNWAHVGGLLAGVLAGIVCLPNMGARLRRRRFLLATSVPLLVALFVAGFAAVFTAVQFDSPCAWCRSTTCLPVNDWCDI